MYDRFRASCLGSVIAASSKILEIEPIGRIDKPSRPEEI